jgi:predicted HicB family RNase H-like nuclease
MAKKQRKAEPEKKPVGRPKTLPAELNTRFQIRCAKADEKAWKAHARKLGYSAGQWIRKVLNDALAPAK